MKTKRALHTKVEEPVAKNQASSVDGVVEHTEDASAES